MILLMCSPVGTLGQPRGLPISDTLYLHRSFQRSDGAEGYLTDIVTSKGRVQRSGFILTSYTPSKSILRYALQPLRWTFNGKTIQKLKCYSGGLPQIAISPDGKSFVCIEGVERSRLLLVRDPAPSAALRVTDVTNADAQQVARSVAFFGNDSVVFLRLSGNQCDTYDAMTANTAAVSRDLRTGRERTLGCAVNLIDRGFAVPGLVKKTSQNGHAYSLDGGATWHDGNLAAACGDDLFFWEPRSNELTSSTGGAYKTAAGTNVVTCQVAAISEVSPSGGR
jgi:hypothetical protein